MKYLAYCLSKDCAWEFHAPSLDDAREGARHHGVATRVLGVEHKARVIREEPLPYFKDAAKQ